MANWRNLTLTTHPTAYFVDLSGSAGGTGTSTDPYDTLQDAITAATGSEPIVIGSGTYTGVFVNSTHSLYGEVGLEKSTIIDLGGGTATMTGADDGLENLTFKNGVLTFSTVVPFQRTIKNCKFIDVELRETTTNNSFHINFEDCEFINVIGFQTERHLSRHVRSKFINTTFYNAKGFGTGKGVAVIDSCDVDGSSNLQLAPEASITEINFNNFRGNMMFQDGTNPDVYVDLATATTEHPGEIGANNINTDPLFTDINKLALTVDGASPNLGTGKSGFNIGNVYRASGFFCDIDPEMTAAGGGGTAVISNLVGTTDKTVDPGQASGTLTTGTLVVDSLQVRELGPIEYIGRIATDSNLGGLSNQQVPDALDNAIAASGNTPERLDFEMRWSTGTTVPSPTVPGDWDNGGIVSAGTYSRFEWNVQPEIDVLLRGNGDPDFDSITGATIGAKWVQIRITLVKDTWNTV